MLQPPPNLQCWTSVQIFLIPCSNTVSALLLITTSQETLEQYIHYFFQKMFVAPHSVPLIYNK